jgi:hypothetical protein
MEYKRNNNMQQSVFETVCSRSQEFYSRECYNQSVVSDFKIDLLNRPEEASADPFKSMDNLVHGYLRDAREIYLYAELELDEDDDIVVTNSDNTQKVNWSRLAEFSNLETLTIVADAYNGFTTQASSNSCMVLNITSFTECSAREVMGYNPISNIKTLYNNYSMPSFEWLTRFPNLVIIDFSNTSVPMLDAEDIVDFLPYCPNLKAICGMGSTDNDELVCYCKSNGIVVLE